MPKDSLQQGLTCLEPASAHLDPYLKKSAIPVHEYRIENLVAAICEKALIMILSVDAVMEYDARAP